MSAVRPSILVWSVLAVAGCSKPPAGDLFPLEAGHHWTYDVMTETENHVVSHEAQVMRSLGRDDLDGRSAWHRRSDSGVDYWLRSDQTGIYRVASKSDLDPEPRPDKPTRYVLKLPLAVGSSWQATTTAYLLLRRQEFPPEIRYTHPAVPMNYQIEATEQTVTTRAGRFEHCLTVRGTAQLRLYADAVVGWKDMPLTTREWYCPGVGLARLERSEPAESTFISGGTLTMELIEWE